MEWGSDVGGLLNFSQGAAVSRPPTYRAAIFAANVVTEVADLGPRSDDRGYRRACASSACLIGRMPMPHYRFSADSAVAAGFVFIARNAPRSRIAALQS